MSVKYRARREVRVQLASRVKEVDQESPVLLDRLEDEDWMDLKVRLEIWQLYRKLVQRVFLGKMANRVVLVDRVFPETVGLKVNQVSPAYGAWSVILALKDFRD